MSDLITHERSDDETRVYAGPDGQAAGHAVPNPEAGHDHEGPHMEVEPIGTGRVLLMLAGFVLLFAALFALGLYPTIRDRHLAESDAKAAEDDRPIVTVAAPHPPTAPPSLEVPGDAQPYQTTSIYPRSSGYLKRRLVDIGDTVKEGQLLAEIDTPEVDAQLAAAQANLQQAQANAGKAKDDFDLAQATYERYETFSKTGGVTQQQLDERRSALTSAKAVLASADAAVKADEAEVQRLTSLQGFEKVYAPFSGTITTRGYDVGALLASTNNGTRELFTISQVDVLRVFVDIPQSYATFMATGQPVKFLVRNYPGKPFEGYIARTSGSINQTTRTLRVEADFPNKEGKLLPGMYGTLRYEVKQPREQLIIPSSALVFGPEGMRVGVVGENNKVRFQPVTLGDDLGVDVEVVNGLKRDDKVVSNPGERLTDGVEVQIAETKPQPGAAPQSADAGKTPGRTAEASAR